MLIGQAEEAEEVLKQCDPVGSSEVAVVQKKMEKLRVREQYSVVLELDGLVCLKTNLNTFNHMKPGSSAEIEQPVSRPRTDERAGLQAASQ